MFFESYFYNKSYFVKSCHLSNCEDMYDELSDQSYNMHRETTLSEKQNCFNTYATYLYISLTLMWKNEVIRVKLKDMCNNDTYCYSSSAWGDLSSVSLKFSMTS